MIIPNLSYAEYKALDGVNFSSLKHMAESPKSYDWHLRNPDAETDAMRFGTAFHSAVLEPSRFASLYVRKPDDMDYRTNAGKAWRDEQQQAGRLILTGADAAQIREMAANFRSHSLIRPFLEGAGAAEVTLTWTDAETGIACKGKLDRLLDDGRIFGVKTTTRFAVRQFQSHAWELFYHGQWAFYHDGAVANGIDPREVAEGVISTNGPYDCGLYQVNAEILKRGRDTYRGWLRSLAVYRERNEWPGQYPDAIQFQAPAWAGTGEFDLEHSIGAFVDALKREVL